MRQKDPTLKRCFGKDGKISDCLWEDVAKLKSVSDPEVRMARLVDLLEWLAHPSREAIWVLLDIKVWMVPHSILYKVCVKLTILG